MTPLIVWLAVTISASTGITYAPVTFSSQADCQAFAEQIPKSAGTIKCYPAKVLLTRPES